MVARNQGQDWEKGVAAALGGDFASEKARVHALAALGGPRSPPEPAPGDSDLARASRAIGLGPLLN